MDKEVGAGEAVVGRSMGIWKQNRVGRARSVLFAPSKGHRWAGTGLVSLCPMITVEGALQGGLDRFHVRELPEQIAVTCKLQIATDPGVSF